jgi:hypothetical protein
MATAATSLYWFIFAALIVIIVIITRRLTIAGLTGIAAAVGLGLLLASPALWPFVQFARTGVTRPLEVVALLSATPAGLLVSTSRLYAGLTAVWFRDPVNVFFPGLTAIVLAAIGVASSQHADIPTRRRVRALAIIAVAGLWLSLGPSTAIYRWLYEVALPLRGIRAAARFAYLFLLVIALMAGFGIAWVERRVRRQHVQRWLIAAALILVTVEVWQGPVPVEPFAGVPRIYTLLRDAPSPVLLVEMPFYPADAMFENGEYVLNATAHWQPVMNGYSGFTPDSYRARADLMWFFPEARAIASIHREGATHVMVHLERFGSDAAAVERAMAGRADFRLLAADRFGHRLYEVVK